MLGSRREESISWQERRVLPVSRFDWCIISNPMDNVPINSVRRIGSPLPYATMSSALRDRKLKRIQGSVESQLVIYRQWRGGSNSLLQVKILILEDLREGGKRRVGLKTREGVGEVSVAESASGRFGIFVKFGKLGQPKQERTIHRVLEEQEQMRDAPSSLPDRHEPHKFCHSNSPLNFTLQTSFTISTFKPKSMRSDVFSCISDDLTSH